MCRTISHAVDMFYRDYERHVDLTEEEEGTENQQGTVNRRHHQYNDAGQHGQTDTRC